MFSQITHKDSICKKPDCKYYSKSTHSCDYVIIEKRRRGCPAENCTMYEPGKPLKPGKQQNRANFTIIGANKQQNPKEDIMEIKEETATAEEPAAEAKPPRKSKWSTIFADIENGASVADACDKHGVSYAQLKQAGYRRKNSKKTSAEDKMQFDPTQIADVMKKVTESMSEMETDYIMQAAVDPAKHITDLVRKQSVEIAFDRVSLIMQTVLPKDDTSIKASALDMVYHIIDQTTEQLGGARA